jgi:hypothetical protein
MRLLYLLAVLVLEQRLHVAVLQRYGRRCRDLPTALVLVMVSSSFLASVACPLVAIEGNINRISARKAVVAKKYSMNCLLEIFILAKLLRKGTDFYQERERKNHKITNHKSH